MAVDTVFFDAYGTLFDLSGVAIACAAVAPRPDSFVAEWRRRQLEYSWLRSLMGRYADFDQVSADALDATAEAEGVILEPSTRERLLAAWLRPAAFPDVDDALVQIGRHPSVAGRLGILSNGSPAMLATVLQHTGLNDRFQWVLSVDAVRTYKPAPAVYALAVRASGAPAARILFVSSNAWDVAGATAFGFPSCWVNRFGASPERLGETATYQVKSLGDILRLIA